MYKMLSVFFWVIFPIMLNAQIDLDSYKQYMKDHKNMTYDQMLQEFDVGTFTRYCPTDYSKASYFDVTNKFMHYTPDELQLIKENGFVVTERKEVENYIKGYYNIYVNDLPVYISADVFNHALFYTMTKSMKLMESKYINNLLYSLIADIRTSIPNLNALSKNEEYTNAIRDLDVIFCVAQNLANQDANYASPHFQADKSYAVSISEMILSSVENGNPSGIVDIELPSKFNLKKVDLSQYKPRGHYDTEELRSYFMSMMWMGRLFLTIPASEDAMADEKSSVIMTGLVQDLIADQQINEKYQKLDKLLEFYISEQNNLTPKEVEVAYEALNLNNMAEVIDNNKLWEYCLALRATEKGVQLYNTQVVEDIEFEDDGHSPQYFALLGQRPTVDAFIFGNVVYPKLENGARRMLPEAMDVLFALGNDAASHLLGNEINKYGYASNLSSARYLFDNMSDKEWESSIYNLWINVLRTLNPQKNREEDPKFMQAAAWQHKNMSTQLASWAELRHLTVLYVKQSYTGMPTCEFPDFFIGPRPEYFEAMGKLNQRIVEMMDLVLEDEPSLHELANQSTFFNSKKVIFDKLKDISQKQYNGSPFSDEDIQYIREMVFVHPMSGGCTGDGNHINGWLYTLFHEFEDVALDEVGNNLKPTKITTDVHTSPANEDGYLVGWVKHAATGDQNYCTIVTDNQSGNLTTYTGVVNSYYEYVTENFQRDTDAEWLEKMDQIPSPDFTYVFRADKDGNRASIATLVRTHDVSVEDNIDVPDYSVQVFPSVFEDSFTIAIDSKKQYDGVAKVAMFSSNGEMIFSKSISNIPDGKILFNSSEFNLQSLTSGVYIIELRMDDKVYTGKAIKIK